MSRRDVVLVLASLVCSAVTFSVVGVHAEQQAAVDRALMERMVRALEDQSRATDKLVQATERCKR